MPILFRLALLLLWVFPTALAAQDDPLDRWIGQMLMVGFRGLEVKADDPIVRQITELGLGGVILFDYDVPSRTPRRNIASPDQLRRLVVDLQAAAEETLFVAIDQEGGRVNRLKSRYGFPESRSQAELGRLDRESETRAEARRTARLLRELGINVNFAPVLDVAVNPENPVIARIERSFSAAPEAVTRHGRWMLEEFRHAGILTAVKHFPGHGSSRSDSHLGMPDVSFYWLDRELEPFRILIAEGRTDMVMTAHLFNRRWDRDHPATLSPFVVQVLLRERLGFDGLVVSDDLQMGAVVRHYSFERALELALKAGVDILTLANNSPQGYDPEIAVKAFRTIKVLVKEGRISRARIQESHSRIMKVKARLSSGR